MLIHPDDDATPVKDLICLQAITKCIWSKPVPTSLYQACQKPGSTLLLFITKKNNYET
jgi:hypothetical protein